MKRSVIIISLLLLLTSFIPSKQISKSIPELTITKTIPLKSYKHLYYIEVKINDRNANLLIDTGAAFSLFDVNQANKYGFKYVKSNAEMIGLGGKKSRFNIHGYKVDHEEYRLLIKPYGAEMNDLINSFSENGLDILGILGSDYFTVSNAIIDYKNKTLIIH